MRTSPNDRIIARLPKSRIARAIVTLAGGTAIAQIIAICVMPIVTRLYTPADIGVVSLFLAFFSFWAGTLSLRYEYALLIAADDTESHYVHRLAMLLVVPMSLLAIPILWGLRYIHLLGFGLQPSWAAYIALPILLGYGWFMVYRSWALRAGSVKLITKATIAQSMTVAVMRVVLGLFHGGIPALFATQCAKSWVAQFELLRATNRHFAASRPVNFSLTSLSGAARKFVKFPMLEAPSVWVSQAVVALPVPMVAALAGASAAGWLGLAMTLVSIPNAQIGTAVADVFQMELGRAVTSGDVTRARSLFYKLLSRLALIGLLPLVTVIVAGPRLLPWILGERWLPAGQAAAVIAPWLYAALIISPLSRALSVLQAQEYKLIYDIVALALMAVAFFYSKSKSLNFIHLTMAISSAGLGGYIVYLFIVIGVVESRWSQEKKGKLY